MTVVRKVQPAQPQSVWQFEKHARYRPDLFEAIWSLSGQRKDNRAIVATAIHAFENYAVLPDSEPFEIAVAISVGRNYWPSIESLQDVRRGELLFDDDVLLIERLRLRTLPHNFNQS
jgi:hypothetical protein